MSTFTSRLILPVSTDRDHVRGPVKAPITLLEYGDYECPFCGAAHPIVNEVRRRAGDRLRFVYRHFPLTNVHPHAQAAAESAEAAGAQGRFWQMHDLLFEAQDALGPEDLVARAEVLGLDVPRFVRELEESVHRSRVREDFMSGVRSGVNGTPSFFVNEVRHEGAADVQSLLWSIEHARVAA